MDGDTDTFSSKEQANAGRSDRFKEISRNLASISGQFRSSLSDETGANNTHTCLDAKITGYLDNISQIADWIRGVPLQTLEAIEDNSMPTSDLREGWEQLSSLADLVEELPAIKAEWAGNVARLQQAVEGINSSRKACASPDDEEGGGCDDIAAALNKLAEALTGGGEGGKEGIMQKLDKICAAVGCDDFPVNVPECVTDKSRGMTKRGSIPQLITWHLLQMDAMIGKFPLKIKIKDADLDEEGDQEKEVILPNLAEAIAEIYGQASIASIATGTLVNIATRNLIESGAIKKSSIQTFFWAEAIADYLGFQVEEHYEKVPYAFNPKEVGNLEKALESCEVEIPCMEFKPTRKNDNDFQFSLRELMTAAGIVRAAFFNPLDKNNPGKQLKQDLRHLKDDDDEESFDDFVNSVEKGFIDKAGTTEQEYPYGRLYSQRPKIREVGGDGDAKEDI